MNTKVIATSWEHFRPVVGIGLRAVAAIPAASLDAHPVPGMRTPKELAVHAFSGIHEFPKAVRDGSVGDYDEARIVASLGSRDALVAWCRKQWDEGTAVVTRLSDAQIQGMVHTPWGGDFSGFAMLRIVENEFWHHRGQLYAFLRALGVEPAMLYDYENNASDLRPVERAKA